MNKLVYLLLLQLVAPSNATSAGRANQTTALWVTPAPSREAFSLRPVRWSLVGGSSARAVSSGRTVPIVLEAEIAKGWHLYSLTQKPGGPIPLRLQLLGGTDLIVRGVIKAPKPVRVFDRNFGIETETYSGNPSFTIPVGVPGRTLTGIRRFQIAARYQVCSDKLCLPPRTDKLD